jgi:hypothetical protein
MFHSWLPIRTFVPSPEATAEIDRNAEEFPRIYEEMMGVEWVLCRKPEVGTQVAPDVYLYVNKKATANAALISVLYSYDENTVDVLRIWIRH